MRHKSKLVVLVAVAFAFFLVFVCSQLWTSLRARTSSYTRLPHANSLHILPAIQVPDKLPTLQKTNLKCRMFSCFDIYRCKYNENSLISVYVYPQTEFIDSKGDVLKLKPMSQQYYELITSIQSSSYYTSERDNACIVIPSIDTLNQNGLNIKTVSKALGSLPRSVLL